MVFFFSKVCFLFDIQKFIFIFLFRESDLATDENLLKHLTREMVYQWIGNLITPHWWSEVHINKALANFIAYIISLKVNMKKDYIRQISNF